MTGAVDKAMVDHVEATLGLAEKILKSAGDDANDAFLTAYRDARPGHVYRRCRRGPRGDDRCGSRSVAELSQAAGGIEWGSFSSGERFCRDKTRRSQSP